MTDKIDFYHKWLGIPPEEQPADHYRLLGIKRFESDLDVITNAADRQMRHIKTFQNGPYSDESQQLLNEISAARVCLSKEAQKAEYDEALKKLEQPTETVSQDQPSHVEPSPDNEIEFVPTLKPRVTARRKRSSWKWSTLVAGLVSGVIAGLLLFMAMQDGTDDSKYNEPASIATTTGQDGINKPAKKKEISRENGLEGNEKPDGNAKPRQTGPGVIVWQDEGSKAIRMANVDGTNIRDIVSDESTGTGLAVDFTHGKVYWTRTGSGGSIQRADIDGSNIEDLVTTGLVTPLGITLDVAGGKMYWADQGPAKISRANLDGTDVEVLVTTGTIHPHDIGLDIESGKMYWTDSRTNKIQRANIDGTGLEDLITLSDTIGSPSPRGLAVDYINDKIYWCSQGYGLIQRSSLDGSNIEDLVHVPGWNGPDGIALDIDAGKMYWTALNEIHGIQRANLDGSIIEDLVMTGQIIPRGIDVGIYKAHQVYVTDAKRTYNARKDFSKDKNPNGVWSYGWSRSLGGNITLYPDHLMDENGFYTWRDNHNVIKIPVVGLLDKPLPWGFVPGPNDLGFHPGRFGEISIVRWTAPSDGTCSIAARLAGAHSGRKEVFVYHNEVQLLDKILLGDASVPYNNAALLVHQGDRIDFAVKAGQAFGDSCTTLVDANIDFTPTLNPTPSPEFKKANKPVDEPAILTHRYEFNTDASDSAGNNHGTLTNGASIVFDAERGGILQLDGDDDYVNLGFSNVPDGQTDTSVFTIAAWIKIPVGDVAFRNIAGIYGEYTSYKHPETGYIGVKNYFAINGESRSGELLFEHTPHGGGDISSTSTINDGEWHHVAYVQNEGGGFNRKIYIDGKLDSSDNSPEVYKGLAPDLWAIGARLDIGSERHFKGFIDEVRFYNGALLADDIAVLERSKRDH